MLHSREPGTYTPTDNIIEWKPFIHPPLICYANSMHAVTCIAIWGYVNFYARLGSFRAH